MLLQGCCLGTGQFVRMYLQIRQEFLFEDLERGGESISPRLCMSLEQLCSRRSGHLSMLLARYLMTSLSFYLLLATRQWIVLLVMRHRPLGPASRVAWDSLQQEA